MALLLDSDGTNYTTFLKSYSRTPGDVGEIQDIVEELIGQRVALDEIRDCDIAEITAELRDCLGYAGEQGAGPGPHTLQLPEFSNLLQKIIDDVAHAIEHSYVVKSFQFVDGHPAYPVFWSFAFLILGKDCHQLLVGSSSD